MNVIEKENTRRTCSKCKNTLELTQAYTEAFWMNLDSRCRVKAWIYTNECNWIWSAWMRLNLISIFSWFVARFVAFYQHLDVRHATWRLKHWKLQVASQSLAMQITLKSRIECMPFEYQYFSRYGCDGVASRFIDENLRRAKWNEYSLIVKN